MAILFDGQGEQQEVDSPDIGFQFEPVEYIVSATGCFVPPPTEEDSEAQIQEQDKGEQE